MRVNHQIIPTRWEQRENLRNKGQFWTPDWITIPMVEYVSKSSSLIFDPAAGTGAFLQAILTLNKNINFYGIDIDENVLKSYIYSNNQSVIENRDFIKNPPNRKFKSIVANPPYIRHHRIDENTKIYLKQMTKKITGFTIDGRAGLHIYFLLQALYLLEDDGRLAFIMPADTTEGIFSSKLWNWITKNFCLECVITFSEKAAPFPEIDTNAMIFLIKNKKPNKELKWIYVKEANIDLTKLIHSEFNLKNSADIEIIGRDLHEALTTGLSRQPYKEKVSHFKLSDFATIMRGIATGANEFFFLTKQQITELNLPFNFFKRTIGRTRDIQKDILTIEDLDDLDRKGRPTYLLYIEKSNSKLPVVLINYIKNGEKLKINERSLVSLRKPWYKSEKRKIPEMLFAYLGRRNSRFIRNEADAVPLHCLHCVYTHSNDRAQINNLWQVLNHPETLENLKYVSKSYGSGALKAEPQNLKNLMIPEKLVEMYKLITFNKTANDRLFY